MRARPPRRLRYSCVGAAAGYGLGAAILPKPRLEDQIVGDAIVAHTMYAAEKLHVVEVGADQKDHLVGWLSKRVGTSLVAADFTVEGFDLVGGRLLPLAERPSAQFMYQDQSGNRVSLYVTGDKDGAETGFRRYAEDGALALYWVDKGYCYARDRRGRRGQAFGASPIRPTGNCSTAAPRDSQTPVPYRQSSHNSAPIEERKRD